MADAIKINPGFWVIERYLNGRPVYWCAGAKGRSVRDEWAEDFSFATKLASMDSASQVLIHICGGEGREVFHEYEKRAGAV